MEESLLISNFNPKPQGGGKKIGAGIYNHLKRVLWFKLFLIICIEIFSLSKVIAQATISFGYTGAIQTWTVPAGVTSIKIHARGAQGGSTPVLAGGAGAVTEGAFTVIPGQSLKVLVGQWPGTTNNGGGGGTFVVKASDNSPLIVAGGGGGAAGECCGAQVAGLAATINTSGINGASEGCSGGLGGASGNGGGAGSSSGYSSGGGGGLITNGGNAALYNSNLPGGGGSSFFAGGAGGIGYKGGGVVIYGGFGGGGGAGIVSTWNYGAGGGGGGYSGGGGTCSSSNWGAGGGGGSFNSGSNQVNSIGNTGNGSVVITLLSTSNPTISAANVTGIPGTQVVVPVTVADFANIVTAQGSINYNNSVATLAGVEQFGLPSLTAANFNINNPGVITYSWDDQTLQGVTLPDNTVIFALRYNVIGVPGSSTPISFVDTPTPTEFTNSSLNVVNVTKTNGSISIPANYITTDALASNAICAGNGVNIGFNAVGGFNGGNMFTAQLSDASGSFGTPVNIGSGAASPIAATIPAGISAGSNYRIRIVSSSPAVVGSDNGSNITIMTAPVATASANTPVCGGASINLTATGGNTYSWTGPNGFTSSQQNPVIAASTAAMAGTYTVTVSNAGGCSNVATVNVTVNEAPAFTTCPANQSVNLSSGCTAVVNYASSVSGSPAPTLTYAFTGATTGSGNGNGSGTSLNVGTTTVTLSATNSCSTTTCSFTVTVVDNQAPVLTCPSAISVNNTPGTCGAVVTFTTPTATDNCGGGGGAGGSQTFNFTGSMQTFTAPATGTYTLETWGAQGGNITSYSPVVGGLGGYSTGTVNLTAGQTINIFVGGKGADRLGDHPYNNCEFVPGGWNGGGANYSMGNGTPGGGASDIRVNGTTLNNRVIVAGGGGGGGWQFGKGGAGGGLNGANGTNPHQGVSGAIGGGQSSGGAAGTANPTGSGCGSSSGTFGQGGIGAGWSAGGGGGGGGYYGGGGGGYADGGGGGSSYIGGVSSGSTTQGVRTGNGLVTITWNGGGAGGGVTLTQTAGLASGSVFPVGTTTNTFTATDASGNTSTCSFDVVVTDNEAPVVACAANLTVCDNATPVLAAPTATDNCGIASVTNNAPASFPTGTTVVTWTVTDVNGNVATCTQNVTVTPTSTAPVASYNSPLAYGGTLQLAATTVAGATYSWTGPNGFTSNLQNPVIANVNSNNAGVYSVVATINGCTSPAGTVNVSLILSISGIVRSESSAPINTVSLTAAGGGNSPQNYTTTSSGAYNFTLGQTGNYTVSAAKSNDVTANNGVTTLDIALIRRHILNVQALSSPYKLLAADVDASNTVSTSDIAQIRSLILTTTNSFGGQQWKFVPASHVFATPANPFPAPAATLTLNGLSNSLTSQDFVGIKLGDVNNTWDNTIARLASAGNLELNIPQQSALPGTLVTIPVRVKDFNNVSGYQFTLSWNPQVLVFDGINHVGATGAFGTHQVANGKLTTSWDNSMGGSTTLSDGSVIFEVRFRAIGADGTTSPVSITSDLTRSIAYNQNLDQLNVVAINGLVRVSSPTGVSEGETMGYVLAQNQPNPFSQNTTIGFTLPKTENVTLVVYNSLGQIVAKHDGKFGAGEHQLTWEQLQHKSKLSAGTYFYQFTAGKFTATKRMIFIGE